MYSKLDESFQKAKDLGFKIIVSTSYTAPYKPEGPGFAKTDALWRMILANPKIDYLATVLRSRPERADRQTSGSSVDFSDWTTLDSRRRQGKIVPILKAWSSGLPRQSGPADDQCLRVDRPGVLLGGYLLWASTQEHPSCHTASDEGSHRRQVLMILFAVMAVLSIGGLVTTAIIGAAADKYASYGRFPFRGGRGPPAGGRGHRQLPRGRLRRSRAAGAAAELRHHPAAGGGGPGRDRGSGATVSVNDDAHRRVWFMRVPPTASTGSWRRVR